MATGQSLVGTLPACKSARPGNLGRATQWVQVRSAGLADGYSARVRERSAAGAEPTGKPSACSSSGPDLHPFDWLLREERQFDRDGYELDGVPEDPSRLLTDNIETLFGLWQSSWSLKKRLTSETEAEPVLLPTLKGVTRLVQAIRTEQTVILLKMVISRFVADRTPPQTVDEARSKYLYNPQARLTDIERTRLIEAHLRVGGELSRRFIIDPCTSFLLYCIVPSVEDLKLLHAFLIQINPAKATQFWKHHPAVVSQS
ncbi:uncharacterized protein PGTG_21753 [Puccinia graminis f. sp. tritici CRL 75-36-700-3]|uniref:Uncharacterized protein n=1 Tax=Puccinia graminis f. sp. tritici (strain CRL 75-36-700-3 / race SCCL) TaxID=418459 RepID=H6QSD6_PUCGT|nr:uncharacterized protein PGTG_21753 [Puccinia graminis f. sp. tritici CRL 75-36-700-3]EHS63667.1 hypothetical protein PGTG_21753 [Puccinia graminis f. sp. tritici CRL 75-36-700-3]